MTSTKSLSAVGSASGGAQPDREPRMNVSDWLRRLSTQAAASNSKGHKLGSAIKRALERTKALQLAYFEQSARKAKHFEIASQVISDAQQGISNGPGILVPTETMRAERVWG